MSSVIAERCVDHMDQVRPGRVSKSLMEQFLTPRGMGCSVSRPIIEGLPWARRRSRVRVRSQWAVAGPRAERGAVAVDRWPVLGVGRCSGWAMRTLTRDTNTSRMA
jgi:hypothetical protein